MLRIVFDDEVFTAQYTGGVSRAFAELADGLLGIPGILPKMPFPLTANYHLGGSRVFCGRALGPRWRVRGTRRLLRLANRRAVAAALARGEADIVQATWYDTSLPDRAGSVPVVAVVHDMLPELLPPEAFAAERPHDDKIAFLGKARCVIAVSDTTARDLCRLTRRSRESVRVVHHGVSPQMRWTGEHARPRRLPEPYLLLVGQRGGYKNFLGVAASVARLLRRNRSLHLLCVGGGAFTSAEEEPFVQAGVAERIHQIGADDALLAACYAYAEVFLFPSLYEGFGLPLLEALLNRCPVISSNRGALPEIADDAAVYFDPDQPDALIELFERVSFDRRYREALISQGSRRVADFSWRRAAANYAAIYRELV